jgi:hypothetical protein
VGAISGATAINGIRARISRKKRETLREDVDRCTRRNDENQRIDVIEKKVAERIYDG